METNSILTQRITPVKTKKSSRSSKKRHTIIVSIITYTLIAILSISFLLPFLWMLSSSFKEYDEIYTIPVKFFPKNPIILNFKEALQTNGHIDIFRGFLNTCIIVIPSTIVGCLTAALAAFAFAKIPFKGRDVVFFIFVATMAIPGIILLIPSYMIYTKFLKWTGDLSWLPLMIPGMFGGAGAVFFTRQFMRGIPKDIEDAARIDGLSWWGIFWRIELPLAKPILVSNFIFGFIGGYNDWLGPSLYITSNDKMKTLQQMISGLNDMSGSKIGVQMAGSVLALIPTFLIFVICQKQFLEGVNLNGGKDD